MAAGANPLLPSSSAPGMSSRSRSSSVRRAAAPQAAGSRAPFSGGDRPPFSFKIRRAVGQTRSRSRVAAAPFSQRNPSHGDRRRAAGNLLLSPSAMKFKGKGSPLQIPALQQWWQRGSAPTSIPSVDGDQSCASPPPSRTEIAETPSHSSRLEKVAFLDDGGSVNLSTRGAHIEEYPAMLIEDRELRSGLTDWIKD